MDKRLTWVSTAVLAVSLVPGLAWAGREKLDKPLRALAASKSGQAKIIVQLKLPPGYSRRPYGWLPGDAATLAGLKASVTAQKGSIGRDLYAIRAFSAEVPAAALDGLSNNPQIDRISQNWSLRANMDMVDVALEASVARTNYGLDGTGVGVAVIDSGIASHADLTRADGTGTRVVAWRDLVNNQATPYDDNGHGTHVAGIIGSNGRSSSTAGCTRTFRGIAPNCNLIGVKALDVSNAGPTDRIIAALQWCVDNRTAYNIRIINLSMGHAIGESSATDPLCLAAEQANDAGILVVCSAGNRGLNGYASVGVPGNDPKVITVGAIKHGGYSSRSYHRLCDFSSRGPTLIDQYLKPDVVSVGNRVTSLRSAGSTLDNAYPLNRVPPTTYGAPSGNPTVYFSLSGTSMAAPTVAGCAALMIQRQPSLGPATVKARIMKSSEKVTFVDIYGRGCGYLDIDSALACMDLATSALSPVCTLNANGTVTVNGESFPSNSSVWSLLICLGVNFAWGENNCAGESFVWTSDGLTGENYAAGESSVSGYGESF
jgi:serine protease AprX